MTEALDLDAELADLMDEDDAGPSALADAIVSPSLPHTAVRRRDDPSIPPYPRGLILDLLLKTAPVADLLVAYKLSVDEFQRLTQHPVFRQDMRDMRDRMREEGFSFRVKAGAQAEAYLTQAWNMVHDPETPASVRADLLKFTIKLAGFEPKPQTAAQDAANAIPQMAEQLKNLPQGELEMRVYSIIMKKAGGATQTRSVEVGQNSGGETYDAAA